MQHLEKINPSYQELLIPLKKWKVLSLKELKKESGHIGSMPSFYKIIRKLENFLLIESFIDAWSNQKFLYLLPNGLQSLGLNKNFQRMSRESRFHDAQVVKVTRKLQELPQINEVFLDFKAKENFPFLEKVPDAILQGGTHQSFTMALEVELTQKNKTRLEAIFKEYSESPFINNVLYIFSRESTFESYKRLLISLEERINVEKFLFLVEPNLTQKEFDLLNSKVFFKRKTTTLAEIFKVEKSEDTGELLVNNRDKTV